MLSFLYPAFLLGALAVAIPVLLHLLRSQQAPEIRFSAMRLLRGVRVEHAERRRVRHWLLLALRAAALLLLALAFARPYLPGATQSSGAPLTILAIDRSASMAPVWNAALEEARRALDAQAGQRVALLAFDDRAELLVAPTPDRGAVEAAIARIAPRPGGTHYPAVLSRAAALLEESAAREGRLVIISDLQGGPADARGLLPEPLGLEVLTVARPFDNLALLAARYEARSSGPATEVVVATVRNDGIDERRVPVLIEAGGRQVATSMASVAPGAVVEVELPVRAEHELQVRLDVDDAVPTDNVRYLFRGGVPAMRVAIVAREGDAIYMEAALRAGSAAEFQPYVVAPTSVSAALARAPRPDVVILATTRSLDRNARDALLAYTEAGGGLLVPAGVDAGDQAIASLMPGVEIGARAERSVLSLGAVEGRHPLFRRLAGAEEGLAHARFTRAWRLTADQWHALAHFDDGTGALYERRVGQGRLALFASDLSRRGNDLPVQPAFVPFLQELVRHLAPEVEPRDLTPASAPAPLAAATGFANLPSGQRVAINLDPRESDPARMTVEEFTSAIQRSGEPRAAGDVTRAAATESAQSLWRYGLMLMLVALIAEGLVGGRPWRRRGVMP